MVQPLDLRIIDRVQQVEDKLQQLEEVQRTGAANTLSNRLDTTIAQLNARVDAVALDLQQERDALSNRLDTTIARLDARVEAVALDLQQERDALSNRLDTTNAHLDNAKEEFGDQIANIWSEIEELEDLIAYVEYCAFARHSPFRELLERIGITTVDQLREREPEELHREMSRIAEEVPHYRALPAVRRLRVTNEIIRWSRPQSSPSGGGRRPEGDRSPDRRRRSGGRGTQTD
jgi:archaellum component FlaC